MPSEDNRPTPLAQSIVLSRNAGARPLTLLDLRRRAVTTWLTMQTQTSGCWGDVVLQQMHSALTAAGFEYGDKSVSSVCVEDADFNLTTAQVHSHWNHPDGGAEFVAAATLGVHWSDKHFGKLYLNTWFANAQMGVTARDSLLDIDEGLDGPTWESPAIALKDVMSLQHQFECQKVAQKNGFLHSGEPFYVWQKVVNAHVQHFIAKQAKALVRDMVGRLETLVAA